MNNGPISWFSKKQRSVALSTVEAEYIAYIALSFTSQEASWLRRLYLEIEGNKKKEPLRLLCDNNGAICLAKNQIISQRIKHIDIRYHFVREKVENGEITVEHIATDEMIADDKTIA